MSYYREKYLQSEHWKNLRISKLAKNKGRCCICGTFGGIHLDVHHFVYRHLYDVTKRDLRSLCRDCHEAMHAVIREFPASAAIKSRGRRWKSLMKLTRLWRKFAPLVGAENARSEIRLALRHRQIVRKVQRENRIRNQHKRLVRILCQYPYGSSYAFTSRVVSAIDY